MNRGTGMTTGQLGEAQARAHLEAAGLATLESNWRCRFGELDLVMDDAGTLVFVEVKARRASTHGGALGAVAKGKQARLTRAAQCFLAERYDGRLQPACRFDVVAVDTSCVPPALTWLRGAFAAAAG